MGDIENWQYRQKLITPEQGASLVKSGDLVHYSEFVLFPEAPIEIAHPDFRDDLVREAEGMKVWRSKREPAIG